jgi:hypothetical protein
MTVSAIAAALVVTIAGSTGIWSAPYTPPPPEPEPIVTAAVAPAAPVASPTTTQATTTTAQASPCATVALYWVDEWTVTVSSVTGPDGHGYAASGVGHFVNYEHNGGPRQSVAPPVGSTTLTLCP